MRTDYRLHPAPTPLAKRGRSPLKRGLLTISALIIGASIIYAAIDPTETVDTTTPNKISLAIPGIENTPPPEKRAAIKPPSVTASPEPVAQPPIPTSKPALLLQGDIS
ncbi:MAG: hypothetical protein GY753_11670, partial [Gammaproteobacteria bacterium]|nr:hypothetical protein [Gammaproteobacteria bacterium]